VVALCTDQSQLPGATWDELISWRWIELVGCGLPSQLAVLADDLSERDDRPVRAFSLAMVEGGIVGLTLPFVKEDWILFDPCLLGDRIELTGVTAGELAHLLYPGWRELHLQRFDEIERFASMLAPMIVERLPSSVDELQSAVEATMRCLDAA
jgi:hypothetical protein